MNIPDDVPAPVLTELSKDVCQILESCKKIPDVKSRKKTQRALISKRFEDNPTQQAYFLNFEETWEANRALEEEASRQDKYSLPNQNAWEGIVDDSRRNDEVWVAKSGAMTMFFPDTKTGPIATGGTSTLWLCDTRFAGTTVVVKRINPDITAQHKALLLWELRAVLKEPHPNIVTVFDAGTFQIKKAGEEKLGNKEFAYVAMEHIPGDTLFTWKVNRIKSKGKSQDRRHLRDELNVLIAVGYTLEFCHKKRNADGDVEMRSAHGDVSPNNIILRDGIADVEHVKLIDFALTHPMGIGSTKFYSDPIVTVSQVRSESDEQSALKLKQQRDVYGYAATVYFCVVGEHPPDLETADNREDQFSQACKKILDPALRAVIRRGMELAPSQRYESALALSEDLAAWQGNYPLPHRKQGYTPREVRQMLFERCKDADNESDHLRLAAQAASVFAVLTGIATLSHFALLGFGVTSPDAFIYVGNAITVAAMCAAGIYIGYIARFRIISVKIYLPLIAVMIATALVALLFVPEKPFGRLDTKQMLDAVKHCMLLMGLASVYLAYNGGLTRWGRLLSWGNILVLAPLVHILGDTAFVERYAPAFHWGSECFICILFRIYELEKAKTDGNGNCRASQLGSG